jgi:hypothetical protein
MGQVTFRTGGTTGGTNFFFSPWTELSEDVMPLEVLACATCGRVEMRVPGAPASKDPATASDQERSRWNDVWGAVDRQRFEPPERPAGG